MRKPSVQVLLATYNGESYLPEFLDSLANQNDVSISLLVSDDNSQDSTLEILKRYSDKFDEFNLLSNHNVGPWENFRFLFENRNKNLPFAFADQDDIWFKDRLIRGFNATQRIPNSLYFTSVIRSDTLRNFPEEFASDSLQVFFANKSLGCTQFISVELAYIADKIEWPHNFPHDWWMYFLGSIYGNVISDLQPSLFYRIHELNTVGIPSFKNKLLRHLRNIKTFLNFPLETQILFSYLQIIKFKPNDSSLQFYAIQELDYRKLFKVLFSKRKFRDEFVPDLIIRIRYLFKLLISGHNPNKIHP